MAMKKIDRYTIQDKATIRQALKKIDEGMLGLIFVVDAKKKLVGIATDGDIRRAFLKGKTVNSPLRQAMNRRPTFATHGIGTAEINKILSEKKIKILPIVDKKRRVIDFIKYDKDIYFPVAQPIFAGNELKYVTDAVLSGWVSSVGTYVTAFEQAFAKFCGVEHAISTCNGTAALHLALLGLGIGPGDEVIVPSFTFIATANAVRYVGAQPIMVDVENRYWQIDENKIEEAITARTRAIIPVHLYGHPAKMDAIMKIAKKHSILVIEDAAEALGAEVNGKRVGAWGEINAFSFFGNKIITTGEGGMLTTNNKALADKIRKLRDHGMSRERRYWHDVLGYNYRLTNLQSAVGLAQLERVDEILKKKIQIAAWYNRELAGVKGIVCPRKAAWAKNVYWMYSICIDPKRVRIGRDELMEKLRKEGVDTRPFFVPVHQQPIYSEYSGLHLPNAEYLSTVGLNLPSSISLGESDIMFITKKIKKCIV